MKKKKLLCSFDENSSCLHFHRSFKIHVYGPHKHLYLSAIFFAIKVEDRLVMVMEWKKETNLEFEEKKTSMERLRALKLNTN